jgi:hypothetical protein
MNDLIVVLIKVSCSSLIPAIPNHHHHHHHYL